MAAWIYYRNEAARHTTASEMKLNRGDLQILSDRLCAARGLDSVRVVVSDRARSWSWFRPRSKVDGKPEISIAATMLNVRILAHEWAHYAHRIQFKKLYNEYTQSNFLGTLAPPRYRPHGPEHAQITDWAVEFLMKPMQEKTGTTAAPVSAPTVAPVPAVVIPKQNLCRVCGVVIPPTGKRGRPACKCPRCRLAYA